MFITPSPFLPLETEGVWRLATAVVLGAILGIERSIAGKHAGMRTYSLVALGSCLFVIAGTIASYELSFFSGINPVQIASSVVLGIGFIGSGLTVFRENHLGEITTATGLWVAAGVGMACGFGLYELAIATTVISLLILVILMPLERVVRLKWAKEDFNGNA